MTYTFITGATGHLGKAFCQECARCGENLYLTGRSQEKLQALKTQLIAEYPAITVQIYPCDLTDGSQRQALFFDAKNYVFSRLINVAGADIQKPFCDYDEDKLTFQLRACLEAAISCCHFALAHRGNSLSIINISSVSGICPMPYFAVYSAAKGALTAFSVALNEECKGTGVTVTAILPGAIYTRPDVVDYIATQGVWGKWAAKTPCFVAQKSLCAAQRKKVKYIPGAANRCIQFFTALVPLKIKLKFIARRWSKTTKDAF